MEYTPEQEKAVIRVMRLRVTDYYGHLLVEKTSTSIEIKKAYRKQALIMHPDKNKAPQADEAFKRISKAFQVLSDETKRRIFDQTGADPDARGGMPSAGRGGPGGGPRGGFYPQGNFGGPRFGNGFPADDIFAQFFGPAGAASAGGPQFHFQFQNGNDIFSQLFGDALFGTNRAQQRRHQAEQQEQASERFSNWLNVGIIIAILILPTLFGMLFDSSSSKSDVPNFSFHKSKPFVQEQKTPKYEVPFFVNPRDVEKMDDKKLSKLAKFAENRYVSLAKSGCRDEYLQQQMDMQNSVGWLFTDEQRYEAAKNRPLPHCNILEELGIRMKQ